MKRQRVSNICESCNCNFETRPSETRRFCNKECYFNTKRRVDVCPVCGKKVVRQLRVPTKGFCSPKCASKARIKYTKKRCVVCLSWFLPKSRTKRKRPSRFCSLPCYWEHKKLPEDIMKDRRRDRVRDYRKRNPDKCSVWKQNRRAREMNAEGSFSEKEWKDLKKEHEQKCALCSKKRKLTVDHVIPLCKGGSNKIENIQPLCMPCNSQKSIN